MIKHKQGKVNIVADALSRKCTLLNLLSSQYLGFDHIKELVPSRIRALTMSRSKSTSGVKVNVRRRLGEETPSASVAKRKRRQGKASPR